jgi:predicted choloylglycine hydrolase
MNRFTAEAKGLASRVGTDWQRVFVANLSYDLVLASLGCSTMALATPQGPVLARNMDWAPEGPLARASVRIDCFRRGELQHRTANWPGGIGVVTGLSARGFAVALNAVFHPTGPDRLGYPVLFFLRQVLEDARDFDDALERVRTQRLAIAGLFTLVGRENSQRVVVERSPREAALRWARGDQPLVATNHYQAMEVDRGPLAFGLTGTSADRCASLTVLVGDCKGVVPTDERLLFALTDGRVIQSITAQHVIARPASNALRVFVPTRLLA